MAFDENKYRHWSATVKGLSWKRARSSSSGPLSPVTRRQTYECNNGEIGLCFAIAVAQTASSMLLRFFCAELERGRRKRDPFVPGPRSVTHYQVPTYRHHLHHSFSKQTPDLAALLCVTPEICTHSRSVCFFIRWQPAPPGYE